MGIFYIELPSMGEGITDATLIKWLVKKGDKIQEDTPIAEIATDKVDSEVPSPISGIVDKFLFNENDVIPIGAKIISVLTNVENEAVQMPENVNIVPNIIDNETEIEQKTEKSKLALSPLVKQLAKEFLISDNELLNIKGTGLNNRITKNDIENYLSEKEANKQIKETVTNSTIKQEPIKAEPMQQGDEIIEMSRMRKIIAEHMVNSVKTSPHVTSFVEVDVTKIAEWRNKNKDEFYRKTGEKLTFLPIFIEAIASVLRDFPLINISVDGTKIIVKKNINIGIATALPDWSLIVPVIKNADQMNLIGITKTLNSLASRARNNSLLPDEIVGGTFTITNLGTFGTLAGTPIINQPQAAILALGEIKKKPAVIETQNGDAIAIRNMVIISLTFDHRVIDGALAGAFLKKLTEQLEKFKM